MASFGATLRRERELRQITLREISEATKVNLRYLEALERDDFRHLPGGVFNKGFVRAFAQYIGIDPDRMVLAYLEEERRQKAAAGAVEEPSPEPPKRAFSRRRPDRSRRNRLFLAVGIPVILVLALAGAVYAGWIRISWPFPREGAQASPAAPLPKAPPVEVRPLAPGSLRFRLVRETTGRLRCSGTERDLSRVAAGTEIDLPCPQGVVIDVDDAGALHLVGGTDAVGPLGPDGTSVRGFLVVPGSGEDGP